MREAVKNYGMLQGEAKRLKKWLEEEFEEDKKYNNFVNNIVPLKYIDEDYEVDDLIFEDSDD
jgi:hypothetical protein